jgi:hypothetical protein
MEYITFIEKNHKENETFIFYLQYTGNEEELQKLSNLIEEADFSSFRGDYSDFTMDVEHRISEDAVDQHCKLGYVGYTYMFQKANGKFEYPFDDEPITNDILHDAFFGAKITYYFE